MSSEFPITQDPIIINIPEGGVDGMSVAPKGEWDSETEYNYLDLVSYNGSSYVALKTVPAGTLPTNTEYWMVSALSYDLYWGNIQGDLEDQTDLKNALDAKADVGDSYTKSEDDALLALKADASSVYTKTEADALLAQKADASSVYTKTATDTLLSAKADKATTYTKTETDSLLSAKADKSDTYTKTQVDSALSDKADKSTTYTKTQTDTLLNAKADTADLGALATMDSIDYTSDKLTNKPTLGTMSAMDDAPSDDKQYLRKNGDWEEVAVEDPAWGDITGTLSDQTDLQNALYDKADVITRSVSGGLVSISDAAPAPVKALSFSVEPVQDLHGYDNPWPGGGGKNLLVTTIENLKSVNTSGTWSGNIYTKNDASFNFQVDSAGNVIGVTVSGTASADANCFIGRDVMTLPAGTYFFSFGTPTNVSGVVFKDVGGTATNVRYGAGSFVLEESTSVFIRLTVSNGNTASGTAKPQIETGSSYTSFEPYSNICPISGWTGANVYDTGVNLLNKNNGTTSLYIYNEELKNSANGKSVFIPCKGSTTYTVSKTEGARFAVGYTKVYPQQNVPVYDSIASNTASSITITTGEDAQYLFVYFWNSTADTATAAEMLNSLQIEVGSSASTYQAYQGTTIPVTWTSQGTVYGANVNLLTGVMTVTKAYALLNDASKWSLSQGSTITFVYDVNISRKRYADNSFTGLICSAMPVQFGLSLYGRWNSATTDKFGIKDNNGIYTLDDIKTMATAGQIAICYDIVPFTVQLDPHTLSTLYGENRIWTDCGSTSLTYRADTGLYVDGQVANASNAIKAMLTNVETSMKATKNYTSGQTVIVGNDYLKLTANVANGGTFTPGTNCTKVTMADWILSIV